MSDGATEQSFHLDASIRTIRSRTVRPSMWARVKKSAGGIRCVREMSGGYPLFLGDSRNRFPSPNRWAENIPPCEEILWRDLPFQRDRLFRRNLTSRHGPTIRKDPQLRGTLSWRSVGETPLPDPALQGGHVTNRSPVPEKGAPIGAALIGGQLKGLASTFFQRDLLKGSATSERKVIEIRFPRDPPPQRSSEYIRSGEDLGRKYPPL